LWADASDLNTIDLAGVPPGQHKVLIEFVNANHQVFPGCCQTVMFTVPETKVSPTLKVAKSAQKPRRSKQFPKLPPSL
jgi:hypothetical protein